MRAYLDQAVSLGLLRQIDLHTGLFLQRLSVGRSEELLLAAALASHAVGEGHICLPLAENAAKDVFGPEVSLTAPAVDIWRENLLSSGVVGRPGENMPLILDEADRLYLSRYYNCEEAIGRDLLNRSTQIMEVDRQAAAALLDRLFPEKREVNWQKLAAALALLKQFVLISGGPGTGKTYTVARILALLQALAEKPLRVALAAPTGKAAFRLQESIVQAKEKLEPDLAEKVPEETLTIHRLLGFHPGSGEYRYSEHNRLHLDLLVLDEASMIDVPLMKSIVMALPGKARLIMLGDRDQLTSVEAGSLFEDICAHDYPVWSPVLCSRLNGLTGMEVPSSSEQTSLGDSIIILQESYRFKEQSGMGELAAAVRTGNGERAVELLENNNREGVSFHRFDNEGFATWLPEQLYEGFRCCFTASSPEEALSAFDNFRVLCAVREGKAGVKGINDIIEKLLRQKGIIHGYDTWYKGKPIMIMANHYGLQLFNGDTGIIWPDFEGRLWAWFVRQDGELRKYSLSRLPDHEVSYATTVHKSQGSEFSEVLFILPQTENRVLNRELIYTGITRAQKKITVFGNPEIIKAGIDRHVFRYSGLKDILWRNSEDDAP